MFFLSNKVSNVEHTKDHSSKSEKGKSDLTELSTKTPAPGHSFVLHKVQLKPIANNVMLFSCIIVELYVKLKSLVCKYDEENDEYYLPCFHDVILKISKDIERNEVTTNLEPNYTNYMIF